jgi:aspartate/methionine/tyrosine aminotransferase
MGEPCLLSKVGVFEPCPSHTSSSSRHDVGMKYRRMPIEIESPEQMGYGNIRYNLAESSLSDQRFHDLELDLSGVIFAYGDHLGKPELRKLIAADAPSLHPDHVMITVGAVSALFIIHTVLLQPKDHMVVVHPNYATNIETPRAIGANVDFLRLSFETGWRVNLTELERLIRPETKLVSVTTPHNPTGVMLCEADLRAIIKIVEARGCRLLVDETYREMGFSAPAPIAASLSDRVISVSSMSKSYGLPGIRLGWLICQDAALNEEFLAAKEQIFISTSLVDEEIAYQALRQKAAYLGRLLVHLKTNFEITRAWMGSQSGFEWVEPTGGSVGFPRIKPRLNIDADEFHKALNDGGTFVGPGHWFECDRKYFRLGFGWPTSEELRGGLEGLTRALEQTVR